VLESAELAELDLVLELLHVVVALVGLAELDPVRELAELLAEESCSKSGARVSLWR
jgi:hypothetical protein